jgi:hypothetical protein
MTGRLAALCATMLLAGVAVRKWAINNAISKDIALLKSSPKRYRAG